jgi:O-antigen/teichoic acid export membrane protein
MKLVSYSLVIKLLGAFTQFLLYIYVSKNLSEKELGAFFFIFSVIMFISPITRLGYDNFLLKTFSITYDIKYLIKATKNITVFVIILIIIFLTFDKVILSYTNFSEHKLSYLYFVLTIFFINFSFLNAMTLQGRGLIPQALATISFIPYLIASIVLFTLEINSLRETSLTILTSWIISSLYSIILLKIKHTKFYSNNSINTGNATWIMLFSFWVMTLSNQIPLWFSQIVGGFLLTAQELHALAVFIKISTIFNLLLAAFNSVLTPKIAQLYYTGEVKNIESMTKKHIKWMLILSAPLLILLIVFSQHIFNIFNINYANFIYYFYIIISSQIISISFGAVNYLLILTNNENSARNISIFNSFTFIILTSILGFEYGLLGITIAYLVNILLNNLIPAIFVCKKLGFRTFLFWKIEV